jgi:hypothetical protein
MEMENNLENKPLQEPTSAAQAGDEPAASVQQDTLTGSPAVETVDNTVANQEDLTADIEKIALAEPIEIQLNESSEPPADELEFAELPDVDYSAMSNEALVVAIRELIQNYPAERIRETIENIRIQFYKQQKAEFTEKKKAFLESGGLEQDFRIPEDPCENDFKLLYKRYRELRQIANEHTEKIKEANLREKYQVIEEIKVLVNKKESINRTFHEFRELQQRWREIGLVPQKNMKELWDTYHYQVEKFYDFIKINQELRDLDLKKNLELKMDLCEKTEELLLETDMRKAVRDLQKFHDQWREIGPVPHEKKDEIWERFREITATINKKFQEQAEKLKLEQDNNLQAKIMLCEKAEEIINSPVTRIKDWENRTTEITGLQKMWNSCGPVPRKNNLEVYQRFKAACDIFFSNKREYFKQIKGEENNNLQLKTDLCIQAETLKESTDWKKTSEDLIRLQEQWKKIGPVPRKKSDELWNRFRAACNHFFNNKTAFYSQMDNQQEINLKKKEELVKTVEEWQASGNIEEDLKQLKQFQKDWTEIGHVPLKSKNSLQEQFRKAINQLFDQLNMDENKRELLKFRIRLENLAQLHRPEEKLRDEREKLYEKIRQLEGEITLWDNNIGFFAKSKNSEGLLKEVHAKIDNGKKLLAQLKEKIKMIDRYDKKQ